MKKQKSKKVKEEKEMLEERTEEDMGNEVLEEDTQVESKDKDSQVENEEVLEENEEEKENKEEEEHVQEEEKNLNEELGNIEKRLNNVFITTTSTDIASKEAVKSTRKYGKLLGGIIAATGAGTIGLQTALLLKDNNVTPIVHLSIDEIEDLNDNIEEHDRKATRNYVDGTNLVLNSLGENNKMLRTIRNRQILESDWFEYLMDETRKIRRDQFNNVQYIKGSIEEFKKSLNERLDKKIKEAMDKIVDSVYDAKDGMLVEQGTDIGEIKEYVKKEWREHIDSNFRELLAGIVSEFSDIFGQYQLEKTQSWSSLDPNSILGRIALDQKTDIKVEGIGNYE